MERFDIEMFDHFRVTLTAHDVVCDFTVTQIQIMH